MCLENDFYDNRKSAKKKRVRTKNLELDVPWSIAPMYDILIYFLLIINNLSINDLLKIKKRQKRRKKKINVFSINGLLWKRSLNPIRLISIYMWFSFLSHTSIFLVVGSTIKFRIYNRHTSTLFSYYYVRLKRESY